jgi:hypothetical protein
MCVPNVPSREKSHLRLELQNLPVVRLCLFQPPLPSVLLRSSHEFINSMCAGLGGQLFSAAWLVSEPRVPTVIYSS